MATDKRATDSCQLTAGSAALEKVESALLSAGISLAGQQVSVAGREKGAAARGAALRFTVRGIPMMASP